MNNRTVTMFPALKNSAAADYRGPAKIELLKGAGHLCTTVMVKFFSEDYNLH